jgi:hypothetical protein
MKKPIPPNIAIITNNKKKLDQPAASPPPATIVTRQVEQARKWEIGFMKFVSV